MRSTLWLSPCSTSARASTVLVFPVPVGPRSRNTPVGRSVGDKPARYIWTQGTIVSRAFGCPTIFCANSSAKFLGIVAKGESFMAIPHEVKRFNERSASDDHCRLRMPILRQIEFCRNDLSRGYARPFVRFLQCSGRESSGSDLFWFPFWLPYSPFAIFRLPFRCFQSMYVWIATQRSRRLATWRSEACGHRWASNRRLPLAETRKFKTSSNWKAEESRSWRGSFAKACTPRTY